MGGCGRRRDPLLPKVSLARDVVRLPEQIAGAMNDSTSTKAAPEPTKDGREQHQGVFRRFSGPEVIEVEQALPPKPARGEVRVRVAATSVQYTDSLIRGVP